MLKLVKFKAQDGSICFVNVPSITALSQHSDKSYTVIYLSGSPYIIVDHDLDFVIAAIGAA